MASRDTERLQLAREAVTRAADDRIQKIAVVAATRGETEKLARMRDTRDAERVRANERHAAALKALDVARDSERTVNRALRERLADLPEPQEAITALDPAYPILLFPVRIETRFVRFDAQRDRLEPPPPSAHVGELRVRIFPDAILADSHEPLLSDNEQAAGRDYWTTAWQNAGEQQDAWTALVAEVGVPRAAWIVKQSEPTNIAALPPSVELVPTAPPPEFPNRASRPLHWHRAPVARLLPERWVVHANPQQYRVVSGPVAEPLALTMAFTADGVTDPRTAVAGGPKIDPEIHWTFDFNKAVEVGMGVRIQLTEADFQNGFESVFVVGVRASLGADESPQELQDLFEHHRVTRGMAFVAQGTPTNNTNDAPSGYPSPDPRAQESFRLERGPATANGGGDGRRFMEALGLPPQAADHIAGLARDEQDSARAMAIALWPATIEYYLKQMLASGFPDVPARPADLSDETIEKFRQHFIEVVRGRGPFPAFRIGNVPYGLLPVSLLEQIEIASDAPPSDFDATLLRVVTDLGATMSDLAKRFAPRVGRTNDPEADLMDTFRMDASAREVYVRPALGQDTVTNAALSVGIKDVKEIPNKVSLDVPIVAVPDGPEGLTLRTLFTPDSRPADAVDVDRPIDGPP